MEKIKSFVSAHKTIVLIVALILLGILGYSGFQKISSQQAGPVIEVDLAFDGEGPYALLFPRRDGNAVVLNIKRTSSYDSISYDLAYISNALETAISGTKVLDEGEGESSGGSIDRGVSGTIETKEKKGEYEQEILFGTCSKNVCKYDKGVENGTLTLHIKKGKLAYRMITQWHLQKPDVALGVLTSGDGHFHYKIDADRTALSNVGFSIINDLTGVPKLPSGKVVTGKVYSLNAPIAKELPAGDVTLELAENPGSEAKIYKFNHNKSEWEALETKVNGSEFSGRASGAGIFAVLINKK